MTETSTPFSHLANISVETSSAPVEQQSTETKVETAPEIPAVEPKTEAAAEPAAISVDTDPVVKTTEPVEPDTAKETVVDDKENQHARELIEARLRAEKAERELQALKPAEKPLGDRPKIGDFFTIEEYDKALDEWNDRRIDAEANKRVAFSEQQKALDKQKLEVAARDAAARVKFSDYDNVVVPIAPIISNSPILRDFCIKNPMGSEVAYELGRNPAVLEQILRQDVWQAGEALLNIAKRLKTPVKVTPTQAPDPIKPVGTNQGAKTKLAELSTADYFAARRRQVMKEKHIN